MICLGGAYSIASIVKSGDGKFRIKPILNNLVHSIPLMTYIFMTILGLLHLSLPAPVVEFAGIVGNANAFMAMLMIGVGFHPERRTRPRSGLSLKFWACGTIIGIALAFGSLFYPAAPAGIPPGTCDRIFGPGGQRQPAFYRADGQ